MPLSADDADGIRGLHPKVGTVENGRLLVSVQGRTVFSAAVHPLTSCRHRDRALFKRRRAQFQKRVDGGTTFARFDDSGIKEM